jgi:hypothetical protein
MKQVARRTCVVHHKIELFINTAVITSNIIYLQFIVIYNRILNLVALTILF